MMSDMREKIADIIDQHVGNLTQPEFTCMSTPYTGYEYCVNQIQGDYSLADAILAALPGMVPELEFVKNNHGQRWARRGPLSYGYWQRSDESWYVMSNNDSNLCGDEEAAILWANTTHRQQLMKALGL